MSESSTRALPWPSWSSLSSAELISLPSHSGLVTLADKGYLGSIWAKIPYRGKGKPEPQKEANRAHAKLRAPGERANAAQSMEDSPQASLLPLARRETRKGHPRLRLREA
jgi:hypothetical protein